MISPETFYKLNIEGKAKEDINKCLQNLKQEIDKLSNYVKNNKECFVEPNFETQLKYNQMYYDYVLKQESLRVNKKLSLSDQQELASKLLKVDIQTIKNASEMLPADNLLMVSLSEDGIGLDAGYKGGIRLLVDNTGEVLYCSSTVISNAELVEEYKKGRRTPIESFNN